MLESGANSAPCCSGGAVGLSGTLLGCGLLGCSLLLVLCLSLACSLLVLLSLVLHAETTEQQWSNSSQQLLAECEWALSVHQM